MEIRISNLKSEFNTISLIRSKIINVFESLKNKSVKLKSLYSEFMKQRNTQLFVFGLDSFHFQSKLIDLEYDDMQRIFLFVNNRMYCEYFKLYKLISCYVHSTITDKKILEIVKGNNFPIYKDLEPFKDYKFETIMDVHDNILVLLTAIASIINNRENELSIHRSKQLIGLNIDNFVNSFNYEITLMKEKINLFLSYMEFFHKLHTKYLKRFSNKIQLMSNHINTDIQFDENVDNNIKNSDNNMDSIDEEYIEFNNNNVNLIDISYNKQNFFENYESGLNTPSNNSYKSTESQIIKSNKKIKIPKIIKNGIKRVSDIINGCNSNKAINELVLEKLINEKLNICLSDFNENLLENEIKMEEGGNIIVEEVSDKTDIFEKETQTDSFNVVNIEEPIVEEPIVEEPIVEEPIVEEPSVEEPIVEEPIVEEPIVEEPIVEEPIVEEPSVEEPIVEEPIVEEPIVEEPSVEEPSVEEPSVEEPIVEEPIVEEPIVEEPIVEEAV